MHATTSKGGRAPSSNTRPPHMNNLFHVSNSCPPVHPPLPPGHPVLSPNFGIPGQPTAILSWMHLTHNHRLPPGPKQPHHLCSTLDPEYPASPNQCSNPHHSNPLGLHTWLAKSTKLLQSWTNQWVKCSTIANSFNISPFTTDASPKAWAAASKVLT